MAVNELKTAELNKIMLDNAFEVLRKSSASAILLFVDAFEDWGVWRKFPHKKELVLVTKSADSATELDAHRKEVKGVVKLPPVNLTRVSEIKLSTIIAVTEGIVKGGDRIVCLSGIPKIGILDTLMLLDLSRESEILTTRDVFKDLLKRIKPEVLETVLNLAIKLSSEGREGRAVGTIFVVGDHEKVLNLSRPLIMNPFKGYPEESRNILDDSTHETVKEFSSLDGAFVIRDDGVIMSAGVHLDAALEEEGLMPGLGCRHMAAAGITDVTDAIALTISGSTGMIRIFSRGRILLEIERPTV